MYIALLLFKVVAATNDNKERLEKPRNNLRMADLHLGFIWNNVNIQELLSKIVTTMSVRRQKNATNTPKTKKNQTCHIHRNTNHHSQPRSRSLRILHRTHSRSQDQNPVKHQFKPLNPSRRQQSNRQRIAPTDLRRSSTVGRCCRRFPA